MKRSSILLAALAAALCLGGLPVFAQRGHGGGAAGKRPGPGVGSTHGRPSSPGTVRNDTSSMTGRKTPGELLTQNTRLSSKLHGLLPANTDLQTAASGFKNLGQFVAAVHVSHNLGIPFDKLKAEMTGGSSLGKAIQTLAPHADAKAEAKKAQKQADQDIKESSS